MPRTETQMAEPFHFLEDDQVYFAGRSGRRGLLCGVAVIAGKAVGSTGPFHASHTTRPGMFLAPHAVQYIAWLQ
jgi:hypothetical protein